MAGTRERVGAAIVTILSALGDPALFAPNTETRTRWRAFLRAPS